MERVNGKTILRRYRARYSRASTRSEKTRILDEFMEITQLKARGHARRLLKGRTQSKPNPSPPGRPRIYGSPILRDNLVLMWRNLDYPSSHLLRAAIPQQIELMKKHGHPDIYPLSHLSKIPWSTPQHSRGSLSTLPGLNSSSRPTEDSRERGLGSFF